MFLHIFWNIRRKKSECPFFKIFRQIKNHLFLENFYKDFSNFSKTTQYIFLIVFGPLRRVIKTSFVKTEKIKNFKCVKNGLTTFGFRFFENFGFKIPWWRGLFFESLFSILKGIPYKLRLISQGSEFEPQCVH